MKVPSDHWDAIADRWLARITDISLEAHDRQVIDAAADLVETLQTRTHAVPAALRRFGVSLGGAGWQLETLVTWIGKLTPLVNRQEKRRLATFESGVALAEGWAEGYVRGAHGERCIEPITGLTTAMVLHLRLNEIYAQFDSLGLPAHRAYCLAVVDVRLDDMHRLDADARMILVADIVNRFFHSGETISRQGGRVLILAPTGATTSESLDELLGQLRSVPALQVLSPMAWIEDLPAKRSDVGRYLRDVVG